MAGQSGAIIGRPLKVGAKKQTPLGTKRWAAPRNARDAKFCDRWLTHFDKDRAFLEAGFSGSSGYQVRANAKLATYSDYLRPYQEAKAKAVAEHLVIGQKDILEAMARKAVFNPLEFVERGSEPIMDEVVQGTGKRRRRVKKVREFDGKPIYPERYKPLSDLTPEQAMTVEIYSDAGGILRYRLPSHREQHQYLISMGRQYGMFLEKLILENHRHNHQHQHLHLENVPTEKLREVRTLLLSMVGREFAAHLGFSSEESAEASRAVGPPVLMPERVKD